MCYCVSELCAWVLSTFLRDSGTKSLDAAAIFQPTRSLVAVEPRRPPTCMTDVGTETAFRLDQRKHFRKSKHLLRSEVNWCDQTSIHGCYVQRQCGNLLKWRRGRKCEHGTMAGYEDAMSNIFASYIFSFYRAMLAKRVTACSSLGFPLSNNTKMSHVGARMQDRPFPGYAGRQSILSLRFFPEVLPDKW